MWEFMQKGGPIMWPILLCSVVAFAIVIERLIRLRQEQIDTKYFMEQISKSLKRNKIMEALDLCDKTGGPIANILKAGILKHDRPRNDRGPLGQPRVSHAEPAGAGGVSARRRHGEARRGVSRTESARCRTAAPRRVRGRPLP